MVADARFVHFDARSAMPAQADGEIGDACVRMLRR
jgi:hypothetical protein